MQKAACFLIYTLLSPIIARQSTASAVELLPAILTKQPALPSPIPPPVSGAISKELINEPRAVIGYISDKPWALQEFLCMLHASWNYLNETPEAQDKKVDLLVFVDEKWAEPLSAICERVSLEVTTKIAARIAICAQTACLKDSLQNGHDGANERVSLLVKLIRLVFQPQRYSL
jgi:hypothetical protein